VSGYRYHPPPSLHRPPVIDPRDTFDIRVRAYLDAAEPAVSGSGGHAKTLQVATALVVGFGLSIDQARPYLELYNGKCLPPWNRRELEHKLEEAAKNLLEKPYGWLLSRNGAIHSAPRAAQRPTPPRKLSPAEAAALWTANAERLLGGWRAEEADVVEESHIRLEDDYTADARLALATVYEPGDLLNVNCDYRLGPDGRVDIVGPGITLTGAEWTEFLLANPAPQLRAGCWFRINPVRSRTGSGRDGSYTDADIARFAFHLFEIDALSLDLQLSVLTKIRVPTAMISDSGGKSYHSLVSSFARTPIEYRAESELLLALFGRYGVDRKNRNCSRFSRLPGAMRHIGARDSEGTPQRLLYLNPHPELTSIL
jgi:hypothetical protein